jgi:hypothetical protein
MDRFTRTCQLIHHSTFDPGNDLISNLSVLFNPAYILKFLPPTIEIQKKSIKFQDCISLKLMFNRQLGSFTGLLIPFSQCLKPELNKVLLVNDKYSIKRFVSEQGFVKTPCNLNYNHFQGIGEFYGFPVD